MRLKERKNAAILRQQEILNGAKSAKRELTKDEEREFEQQQGIIEECTRAIEQIQEDGFGGEEANKDGLRKAIEEERKRVSEVTELCRKFEIDEQPYLKSGEKLEGVREKVLEKLIESGKPMSGGRRNADITVTASEEDKFRAAMADALLMRGGVMLKTPAEGAAELRGMSLKDLAVESLKGEVRNIGRMDKDSIFSELAKRQYYNPTSAFPSIMDQTINKAYKEGYNMISTTFEAFCTEGSLSDFKISKHQYLAGPAAEFEKVEENGEIKADTPRDALLPTRKLETYAKQFTMTRQAFINDDIGFLTTIPARYAKAGKTTINKQVYSILVGNSVIYDGISLFHENHSNLVKNDKNIGKPSNAAIQAMIIGLSSQKNQHGEAIMIRPGYIIVPVGYGFAVQTIFESATIQTPENTQSANPLYQYRSQIRVVEDPTINALAAGMSAVPWFMSGEKSDCTGVQVDYLNGQKIPTIRRMEKPGTLGFVWDIYHDWGVSVVDYRGLVKNPGAALNNIL